jgi:hypothetical protein
MFNQLNKLTKDQRGIVSVIAGVIILLFGLGIIPGLPTLLTISGIALIGLGLYLLEIHTKIMSLINKK